MAELRDESREARRGESGMGAPPQPERQDAASGGEARGAKPPWKGAEARDGQSDEATGRAGIDILEAIRKIDSFEYLRERLGAGLDRLGLLTNLAGDLAGIYRLVAISIHLVDPESLDFSTAFTQPPAMKGSLEREFDSQIETGTIAWVLQQLRPGVFRPQWLPSERGENLVLAPLTTGQRTLGIVMVYVEDDPDQIAAGKLTFQSILGKLYSFSLENLLLQEDLRRLNEGLESEVARRASELARAHSALRTEHERLRQAYEELQSLDRAKDEFVSLVSHELRTPLSSITCYIDVVLAGMVESDAQRDDFLRTVQSEVDRLSRLVNDILDLSKMEAGKMTYRMTHLPMEEPVAAALDLVRSQAVEKGVELGESSPGRHHVLGDRDRLIQVLSNLLANAIRFTPRGSVVSVRTHEREEKVQVDVTDTGIGIRKEDLPRLFGKFERIESGTAHGPGTGLGLAISKRIIEAHKGTIWVESVHGKGSTFSFALPLLSVLTREEIERATRQIERR